MSERKKELLAGLAALAMYAGILALYCGMFDKWIF